MDTLPEHDGLSPTGTGSAIGVALLRMLLPWRKVVVAVVILGTMISAAVAFLLPQEFKATASVFPAERAELYGGMEGVSSLVRSLSPAKTLAGLGEDPELERYVAILKSSRVLGAVISRFDLVHVYDITSYPMEKTTKRLLDNIDISIESEGNLVITVYDEDPQRAADMANCFVDELNRTNAELLVQNARGNRSFIEERYQKNLRDLDAAAESLRVFQKHNGVIAMPEQAEATMKAGAELAGQLALKEVQMGILRRTRSADHPDVHALQIEIQELRRQIASMNGNQPRAKEGVNLFVPFQSIPDLGAEYLRRSRDLEIQYKILQFLTPIYEQAKVEERRNTPSVIVLDRASPPERKARPKRLFIILGGMLVSFLAAIAGVVGRERWVAARNLDTEFYRITSRFLTTVAGDIRSLRKRRS